MTILKNLLGPRHDDGSRVPRNGATRSMSELLRERARTSGDHVGYAFLDRDATVCTALSYRDLLLESTRIASAMLSRGVQAGDRVALLLEPGPTFVTSLFACFHAGVLAVPLPPPQRARGQAGYRQLRRVLEDADPSLLVSDASCSPALPAHVGQDPRRCTTVDALARLKVTGDGMTPIGRRPSGPAYVQYTSGTTSAPRGVLVTHANVLANCAQARDTYDESSRDASVTWVPPYHDMGLVTGIFRPLYCGYTSYLLTPADFLGNPMAWLTALSRFRATLTSAPNFAYGYCARKVDNRQVAQLDLSGLRVARVAGEPVIPETLASFAKRFAPSGFRADMFCPSFGLAEATLTVTSTASGEPPFLLRVRSDDLETGRVLWRHDGDRHIVASGRPVPGTRVRIVDPATRARCENGAVGEVWVAGPQVGASYRGTKSLLDERFGWQLPPERESYVRTGDLGALVDGRLYLLGRANESVIVRGKNHFLWEIEQTASSCDDRVRPGCVAAFALREADTGSVGIAAELVAELDAADAADVLAAVRAAVALTYGIQVSLVVLVERGGIRKTSSGKVQRDATLRALESGALVPFHTWRPGSVGSHSKEF